MHKTHWLLGLLLLALSGLLYAEEDKTTEKEQEKTEKEAEKKTTEKETRKPLLEFSGKVVFVSLEGKFYGIISDAGKRYIPLELDKVFRWDGLPVQVKAKPMDNLKGIHMWGRYIRIIELSVLPSSKETSAVKAKKKKCRDSKE